MERTSTNRVIWHHSLSGDVSVEEVRQWHLARGWLDIGYHYVIHPDGTIDHGRDLHLVGAHASGRNGDSVGVCLLGDFRDHEPTVEQLAASLRLYHELCRHYSKRLENAFHRPLTDENPCPGPMLDRPDFQETVYRGWYDA